ncbi:MAG TPA: 2-oxoacid:ferredoxin oxidoreductase subunit beta [Anaerolineales bacterium]|nr:2-oxoacid:ferredoxin oxidoreductase subunit beta [Anaerolineales bacterium]
MSVTTESQATARTGLNRIGLSKNDYRGRPTTLCQGCGHNSISSQIVAAAFEMDLMPEQIVKLSGIGCSSKSPAYFLNRSHGFNSLHGRMPTVATGALVANRALLGIAVSGDGDTASIGLGHFMHFLRRNVPMVYIVENNGVYGLTKGQFSATADRGQKIKRQGENPFLPIDICQLAVNMNCGFVARSFAGDPRQVKELLKAALSFRGTALLDIISPCVTFNNRDESTKSYTWGKTHQAPLHDVTLVPRREEIHIEYEPGQATLVELHDGTFLSLRKLREDYDPTDREAARRLLSEARSRQELVTGLLYVNPDQPSLQETMGQVERPLTMLSESELRPDRASLDQIMQEMR